MDSNFRNGIDAAVVWPNGRVYFFKGDSYLRYDIAANRVDQDPRPIRESWPGWPESWTDGIQGAIAMDRTWAYFFRGGEYLRYDIAADRVCPGYPRPILGFWPGWPAAWKDGIDGCVGWIGGKVYFFKGAEYLRYDMSTDSVTGGPSLTYATWGRWPTAWTANIRGGVVWPGGDRAYLFHDKEYIRYDIAADATHAGYPLAIINNWPGWPGYKVAAAPDTRPPYAHRIDIYNLSSRDIYALRFNNNDDIKSVPGGDGNASGHGIGDNGHMPPGRHGYIFDISAPYMQIVINTRDGDALIPTRGYLVTDLETSGDRAWVIIADSGDGWDFRAGSGHKYRVKTQPIAFFMPQWIDDTTGAQLKGTGPAVGDAWPTWWCTPGEDEAPRNYPDLYPAPVDLYQVRNGVNLFRTRYFADGSYAGQTAIHKGWDASATTLAVRTGWFYVITTAGELRVYHHDVLDNWDIVGTVIGTGWLFSQVFAGSFGQLYAIDSAGDLYYYEHNPLLVFTIQRKKIGNGWGSFSRVFSGGHNCIYAITTGGDLLYYEHDNNQQFTVQALKIGSGWSAFLSVTSSGAGELFAIDTEAYLNIYRHDANKNWYNAAGRRHSGYYEKEIALFAATR